MKKILDGALKCISSRADVNVLLRGVPCFRPLCPAFSFADVDNCGMRSVCFQQVNFTRVSQVKKIDEHLMIEAA